MLGHLLIASSIAMPKPDTIVLTSQDLLTLSETADTICPLLIDQSIPNRQRGQELTTITREKKLEGQKSVLLGILCTQWQKGYAAGARRRPVK